MVASNVLFAPMHNFGSTIWTFPPFLKKGSFCLAALHWGVMAAGKSRWIMFTKMPRCCLSVVIQCGRCFQFLVMSCDLAITRLSLSWLRWLRFILIEFDVFVVVFVWPGPQHALRWVWKKFQAHQEEYLEKCQARFKKLGKKAFINKLNEIEDHYLVWFIDLFWKRVLFLVHIFDRVKLSENSILLMSSQGIELSCQVRVRMLNNHELFIAKAQQVSASLSLCA